MEFHEKLLELRKQHRLTQEELAQHLYVSRAAVSKWESGRGYPNIDSLKQIALFFNITIDELLSSGEALTIAEEEHKQKSATLHDLVFGLLDLSTAMLYVLPFFGQREDDAIYEVSLLSLTNITPYLKASYFVLVAGLLVVGILTLALQNCRAKLWVAHKRKLSFLLNGIGTLLFIISMQPYAAALLFIFLSIKVLIFCKKQ